MQQQKIVAAVVAIILLIVVAFLLIVGAVFSEGFKHPVAFVYVSSGNKRIMQDCTVALGNGYFEVHTLLPNADFDVKILPTGEDFKFLVDGAEHSWLSEENDVAKAFNLKRYEKGFSVRCKDLTVLDVLQCLYPGKDVKVSAATVEHDVHYKLVISTADNKHSIGLSFRCIVGVDGIELDSPSIVF